MLAELRAGIQALGDGAISILRGDKTGALVVTNGHATYAEPALRGSLMECSNAVAGVAPGTVLTTSPPLVLWNPPSSGKNLIIVKAAMGYVSGTLGGGTVLLSQIQSQQTIPTGGTELVPVCSNLGLPRGMGRVFSGSTMVSVPTIIRPLFSLGAFVGTAAQAPVDTVDVIDGSIIVPPGAAISLQEIGTAGTAPLVIFNFTWEEVNL